MSSISNLHASSDSDSDEDYVPPPEIEVYILYSDPEPGDTDNDRESDGESPKSKKLKLNNASKKNESSTSVASSSADAVWKTFIQGVEATTTYKISEDNVPDAEIAKKEETSVHEESVTTQFNQNFGLPEQETVEKNNMDNETAIAEPELEIDPLNCDQILKKEETFVNFESSKVDDNLFENKSDAKKKHVDELINRGEKHVHGLSSVLGAITGKDKKMSVLEKSKQDWMEFKQSENIAEELETFNKGKQGFVEKQRFLARSDVRSFEIEKSARLEVKRK